MRILITGGAGFIGSHVAEHYLEAGHQVAVFDNLSTGKHSNLVSGIELFEGDITDLPRVKEVFADFAPNVVNHHAAQISVTHSVEAPEDDAMRNVVGTVNLLETVRQLPSCKKFIYASSGGAMYGPMEDEPLTEATEATPMSPYGLSKYVAEQYVWLYHRVHRLTATVLRYSNVYGPRQDPHGEAGVCAIFAERMLKNDPVTVFGDGTPTRDYVYVGDVAEANVLALDKGDNQAFNISTGIETSTNEVFETFSTMLQYKKEPQHAPLRPGEIQRCALSAKKAAKELGWIPRHSFAQGVEKTAEWYKERGEERHG